jgi:hypothetical protein
MVLKSLLVVMVILVLMEDTTSIKKSAKEEEEERELAEAVNKTLAEEERKRQEEEEDEKKRDRQEKEKKADQGKIKKEEREDKPKKQDGQDEACLPVNLSCPIVDPCQPCQDCEACKDCPSEKECPEVQKCGPCPPIYCQLCPVDDRNETTPSTCQCPGESMGMTVPVALLVGAAATLVTVGVATGVGLLLRYVPPMVSGFFFISIIIMVWYLSSQYPEAAREIGGRAANLLREAAVAVSHQVTEAIRRHQEQVGVPTEPNLF